MKYYYNIPLLKNDNHLTSFIIRESLQKSMYKQTYYMPDTDFEYVFVEKLHKLLCDTLFLKLFTTLK